jgi:hypothetical protein
MKLKELQSIIRSRIGSIQWAIVYDANHNKDLEYGCSVDYALDNYGDYEVTHIHSYYDHANFKDYLVITIDWR